MLPAHLARGVARAPARPPRRPHQALEVQPADIDDRARWSEYLDAYGDAIERCNTELAPWHVVPADRKWYRNWAITQLLIEELEDMDVAWPAAGFDVAEQRRRLLAGG